MKLIEKKSLEAGGLYVLCTERHESRRIDNQLRGRTGRQGDPGRSRFYLSTEDDLLRIFGGDKFKSIMAAMNLPEDEPIEEKMMNKAMEIAQKRVEARNFEIRKNLIKYDDVINDQRKQIFEERKEFMRDEEVEQTINYMREDEIDDICSRFMPAKLLPEQWDAAGLAEAVKSSLGLDMPIAEMVGADGIDDNDIKRQITEAANDAWKTKVETMGQAQARDLEKQVFTTNH